MIKNQTVKPECVLVTGASGFIGRHVVSNLLDNGYEVVAHQNRREVPAGLKQRCRRIISGDICDPIIQRDALQDVQVVCHLAAHIPEKFIELKEASICYKVNALATMELATMAAEQGVRCFVQLSTGNIYSDSGRPSVENDKIFPTEYATDYMVSKLAAEIYLMNICQRKKMDVKILRIGTPYGPGESGKKVIPFLLRLAEQGQPLRLVNGGLARYNFVYVTDVADLTVSAIKKGTSGIYNVGSGEHTSLRDLANAIVKLHGKHKVLLQVEPPVKGATIGFPAIQINKARKTFGFKPRCLAIGLREYRDSLLHDNKQE